MSAQKISDLTAKTSPSGSEELLINDGGISKKITIANAALQGPGSDPSLSSLNSTGNQKICKHWVNFNGTGEVSINDSFNVSSISDYGPGHYGINIVGDFANNDFAAVATCGSTGGPSGYSPERYAKIFNHNVSSYQVVIVGATGGFYDQSNISSIDFGD